MLSVVGGGVVTPDRDELREKVARALRQRGHNVIPEDADAVLAALPEYEQVGWTVPELDDIALMDGEGCGVGTYWTVPVYIMREAEG